MSRIDRLIESYSQFIAVPWKRDISAVERVIFCVYHQDDELKLRAKVGEFELATRNANWDWSLFNLTNSFEHWMAEQKYAESYFNNPSKLPSLMHRYQEKIFLDFKAFLRGLEQPENTVVTLLGVGSLYGFLKVKALVDQFAPLVKGRLLILFPGSFEDNNYRLLDAYDGWNYLAVPITEYSNKDRTR